MISTEINNFNVLAKFNRVHVKISDELFNNIKNQIKNKYKSLRNYNSLKLNINSRTFQSEFKKNIYHPFQRIIKIINDLEISQEELYDNILGFYHWGSHRKQLIKIPKQTTINNFFVEGYSLYLAEGDTGFNGKTKPRKLRFTNSDPNIINFFINWFQYHLPNNDFYVNLFKPPLSSFNHKKESRIINHNNLKIKQGYYNKIIKYRFCMDSAIIIDLILDFDKEIKGACLKDKKLAAAYIRGMMIGEGTAYLNRSRYVRIEMRNEKEIKYLHKLFELLGFECKLSLRKERDNMWSLYIGAKQLERYKELIGFGVHDKRQSILDKAVNKQLRVNQYI